MLSGSQPQKDALRKWLFRVLSWQAKNGILLSTIYVIPPIFTGTILVVCHHIVVVRVQTAEYAAATWTTNWRADKSICKVNATLAQKTQRFGHELEGTKLHILVIRDQHQNVGFMRF